LYGIIRELVSFFAGSAEAVTFVAGAVAFEAG